MRTFVLSLSRLYKKGEISNDTLKKFLDESKINKDEYKYIISNK